MEVITTFAVIAGIVFLGFLSEIIFQKTNVPDVLILILTGILIRTGFEWVNPSSFGESAKLFTTFALIFILFQGALSIDFKSLFKSLSGAFKVTITSFIFSAVVVTIITYPIYHNLLISILIGMILAGTSSAVVIPIVNNINLKEKFKLTLTLESAITDVLCIVGALTVLEILATGNAAASDIFRSVLSSFSLAIVTGLIIGVIWIFLLHKFNRLSESYMVTVALVIAIYAFVESPFIKASGAIAALTFGLVLGNSRSLIILSNKRKDKKNENGVNETKNIRGVLSYSAKNFFEEISFFMKTFFFVYLGILIDFSDWRVFVLGAILTMGIYLVRPFAVKLIFRKEKLEDKERTFLEILIPKGLAGAVLAGVAVQSGLLGEFATDFANTILSVVLISIVLTSILVFMTEKKWFKGFIAIFYSKNN